MRINNPDAAPFFIDEASGAMAWDEDARRFRVDRLQVLAGLTHVEMQGWMAPPTDSAKVWTTHLESRNAQFSPERPGASPVRVESMVADARFLETTSQFILDRLTARGPTVDVAVKAETAPDGDGSSLKLNIDVGPERHRRSHSSVAAIHKSRRTRMVRAKFARRTASGIAEIQLDRR